MLTQLVGAKNYLAFWNPDFLSEEMGKDGTVARLYHDKKLAVDVGNPNSKVNLQKKQLLEQYGFQYICFPKAA